MTTTKKTTPQMPTKQIAMGELDGAIVLQTTNIGKQTFAWLIEDDRYMVAIDGNDQHEDACREWFRIWFTIQKNQQVRIHQAINNDGELFTIQIKQTNGL